jgi:hypothetical protein
MGTFKMLFGLAVVVVVIIAGVQTLPPAMSNYQFQDELKSLSLSANYGNRAIEDIQGEVILDARRHDIVLDPKQVIVQRTSAPGAGSSLYIQADYSVPVSILGYSFSISFEPSSGNKV